MKKKAWLYYHIDAPEDSHGTLKGQRQQLMDYAEQMGFEVAGSSCDIGNPLIGGETGLSSSGCGSSSGSYGYQETDL